MKLIHQNMKKSNFNAHKDIKMENEIIELQK